MTQEKVDVLLRMCLSEVETHIGWGSATDWSTSDFEKLSERILESTGTNLSVATLKRLFGVIKYDSQPTATTLNAVAQFVGYENWRTFTQHVGHHESQKKIPQNQSKKSTRKLIYWSTPLLVLLIGFLGFNFLFNQSAPVEIDPGAFLFSSEKMVSEGVPNSVIFEYDASSAKQDMKVFIQQSWDERLRAEVSKDAFLHTSIYYYPGYYLAKLVVEDQIVKEHELYIKTDGWQPMIEQEKVPVYLDPDQVLQDGMMRLTADMVVAKNIQLQPETPWVSFHNVREFENVMSDNFVLETQIRNDYSEGAGVCQHTQIQLLFNSGAIYIPLSIKGCVSELEYYDASGKRENPTALGVDFSDWVDVRIEFENDQGQLFINNEFAFPIDYAYGPKRIVGLCYRFQGAGSVNFVRLTNGEDKLIYEEDFEGESFN